MPTKPVSGRPNGNISDYLSTNGVVVAHHEFDPYGNTTAATGPMVNDFNFWFSSKYLDQETGLCYYGYRYYSPELGRWLSRDPIAEWGGANLLAFCSNDPIGSYDLIGMANIGPMLASFAQGGFWSSVYGSGKKVCDETTWYTPVHSRLEELVGGTKDVEQVGIMLVTTALGKTSTWAKKVFELQDVVNAFQKGT